MSTPRDVEALTIEQAHAAFHAHADVCEGCASGPATTCAEGRALFEAWSGVVARSGCLGPDLPAGFTDSWPTE